MRSKACAKYAVVISLAALVVLNASCGGSGSSSNDGGTKSQSNVKLLSLTLSQGTLSPTFDPGTGVYTVEVGSWVETIAVTPAAQDTGASIRVNNAVVASGSASQPVNLSVGQTAVAVIVTAPDDSASKTYLVMVNRLAAPSGNANLAGIGLSAGVLTPAFSPEVANYMAEVADTVSSINFTPTAAGVNSSITVNGQAVASGSSATINLATGNNAISTVVKSENGTAEKNYTLTVKKLAAAETSHNAFLSKVEFSAGVLQPAFSPDVLEYVLYVPSDIPSITMTPFAAGAGATIKVNDQEVLTGSPSQAITKHSLGWEQTIISVAITAGDSQMKNNYFIRCKTWDFSQSSVLADVKISSGTITPFFNSLNNNYNYSSEVRNVVSSITLTATSYSETADIYLNGGKITSGVPSPALDLNFGNNKIMIFVVNSDVKTYRIDVNRLSGNSTNPLLSKLAISAGKMWPVFESSAISYKTIVPNQITSITLTPSVNVDDQTVTVNGQQVLPGNPSQDISLDVGEKSIPVVVTAGDGTTTKTYTVSVERLPENIRICVVGLGDVLWDNGVYSWYYHPYQNYGPAYYESVYIAGNNVHVSGQVTVNQNSEMHACHFINDTFEWLEAPGFGDASSVFVSNGNVYMAGYYEILYGSVVATYWKDGVRTDLSDPGGASSIFVSGDDVYIAGRNDDGSGYWKNGSFNVLSGAYGVNSISISGSSVYVAGDGFSSGSYAAYWENSTEHALTDGSNSASAKSIIVSGTDIYVAGYEGNYAKYWLNGTPVNLTDGTQEARANQIFLYGSDIYVVGKEGEYAMLWKNGVGTPIGQGEAKSIFVAPQ